MLDNLDGGDIALIVLAAFWGLLVLFLCVVLLNTFRVLESVKMLIDGVREETVPLLGEVKGSVERANRELDRVDGVLESAGRVAKQVEDAVSGPLAKIVSLGAALTKGRNRTRP
ncbi:MAG: DUF948 domain-containing protein [Actinomycetota bacterium]